MLGDNSVKELGLPENPNKLGWIRGHRAVLAKVKSSFPLIIYVGISKSIIYLFLVFLFFSIAKQTQRFGLT